MDIIYSIEKMVCGVPFIVITMVLHIYFTFKLKFPQKNMLKGMKYLLENKNSNMSSYKVLMSTLASTIGIGNIIGVSSAIIFGGPGTIFWIFVSGFFAIATKYAETYICLKYKKGKKGGAMYVLKNILNKKYIAIFFCFMMIISSLGMGAMVQTNAISSSINLIDKKIIGIFLSFFVMYLLFGGEEKIAKFSSILMPAAIILYIVSIIYLFFIFKSKLLLSIKVIIKDAIGIQNIIGGVFISKFLNTASIGITKGLFTNEAGLGTSPLFDVKTDNKDITKQSIISSTAVFIDTMVICVITGIVFVASGMYNEFDNPVYFAKFIFEILPYGKYIFIFFITVFAISSIPCSGYYGSACIEFLTENKKSSKEKVNFYKIIYCVFVFIGATTSSNLVWAIASICNALLIIPNIYMLFKLRKKVE